MSAATRRPALRRVRPLRLTRRELLKLAQVSGLFAATGGLAAAGLGTEEERRAAGICRLCTMHCGVVATSRGDRLLRVEGDLASSTRGFLCLNGQALPEIVHSADRLRLPLERDGDSFREVSWAHALARIAERLGGVKARHGARAVALQTGWPYVRNPLAGFFQRFCHAFGTPNFATSASLCVVAARLGRFLTFGADVVPDPAAEGRRTLVLWGANPTFTAPPYAHLVGAMSAGGRRLIVVDPTRTELAARATLHLQLRPGTDGALALGLIHVLVRDGLYDADFVARHTVGFEPLARLAAEYPPERVAALTGVPAADVVRTAEIFALDGPSAVWDSLGIEHHENGVQTVRAIAAFEAISGHLDRPGGGELSVRPGPGFWDRPLPGLFQPRTPAPFPPAAPDRPIGHDRFPLFTLYNRQAQGMLFARAMLEDDPYPLRAMLLFGANPLLTNPGSARLERAFDRLDLLVTADPFLSESAARSDYVLPAATFAEANGLAPAQPHAWPDWRILFELARGLGLSQYFPWTTLEEALAAPRLPWLHDPGHTILPEPPADPAAEPPRFPTPSGKVELWSSTLARFGHDPLPAWAPPSDEPRPEFPFRLVSGPRTRAFINSQFRHIPSIVAKMPAPVAELHPDAAARLGIAGGDRVAVVSPHGRIELAARLAPGVHPETVVVPAGWAQANANLLTDVERLDPISGFPAVRSMVCRVERV